MDLGVKREYGTAIQTEPSPPKATVDYPTVTIEKKLGDAGYNVGDVFTATVKFRVRAISQGKEYSNDADHHRCTLEMLSMDSAKPKSKGLPQHG